MAEEGIITVSALPASLEADVEALSAELLDITSRQDANNAQMRALRGEINLCIATERMLADMKQQKTIQLQELFKNDNI